MEKAQRGRIVVCATIRSACRKKKKRSACRMEHRSATGLPFSTLKSWGVCLPLEIVSILRQGVAPAEVGFESTHVLEARLTS